ncbi:unnamed protein product [Zymoseptoria tritici ST99CH_3D7]|uniref:Uncharacterized protein n=1 Tax=Zymoseptoria tritici (strain ST99CH_3D7) TaxID=1276538 RepID=A0A1X7RFB3_ZYMT9|nr:unnamed protein product [Zymoseptoria tritici ST99CH_3D7]
MSSSITESSRIPFRTVSLSVITSANRVDSTNITTRATSADYLLSHAVVTADIPSQTKTYLHIRVLSTSLHDAY